MKNLRAFENIQIGNEVEFVNSEGLIQTAIVSQVNKNTFSLDVIMCWKDENNVLKIYSLVHNFLKTGTKSHSHYTYGNAISFRKSPEQILNS